MSKLSYKKLFKMLIDIDMKNTELIEKSGISKSTFYKMKNGENITTDVLLRISFAVFHHRTYELGNDIGICA